MSGRIPSRATQRNVHLYLFFSAGAAKQIMELGALQLALASGTDGRVGPGHPAIALPLVNIYSLSFCLETEGAQPQT